MLNKKFGILDIGLTKLSVVFAVLFLISIWGDFANWAMNTPWEWFLVLCIVFAIRPVMTFLKK
ncbi:MAG: hypothetical protein WCH76_06810 [Candidatus Riflemargulisbacteria bacterium]